MDQLLCYLRNHHHVVLSPPSLRDPALGVGSRALMAFPPFEGIENTWRFIAEPTRDEKFGFRVPAGRAWNEDLAFSPSLEARSGRGALRPDSFEVHGSSQKPVGHPHTVTANVLA